MPVLVQMPESLVVDLIFYYVKIFLNSFGICFWSVSFEYIACVNLLLYIVKDWVVTVCNYCLGEPFEFVYIVYNLAAEESASAFETGLIYDNFGSFGLNAFHYTLY